MFSHLSVTEVLFSFSILPCRSIPCYFPSPEFQLSLHESTNFEVFPVFFFTTDIKKTFIKKLRDWKIAQKTRHGKNSF